MGIGASGARPQQLDVCKSLRALPLINIQ